MIDVLCRSSLFCILAITSVAEGARARPAPNLDAFAEPFAFLTCGQPTYPYQLGAVYGSGQIDRNGQLVPGSETVILGNFESLTLSLRLIDRETKQVEITGTGIVTTERGSTTVNVTMPGAWLESSYRSAVDVAHINTNGGESGSVGAVDNLSWIALGNSCEPTGVCRDIATFRFREGYTNLNSQFVAYNCKVQRGRGDVLNHLIQNNEQD